MPLNTLSARLFFGAFCTQLWCTKFRNSQLLLAILYTTPSKALHRLASCCRELPPFRLGKPPAILDTYAQITSQHPSHLS